MRINDLIMMSLRSLWRRKLRTFLTILGVVIGASSIILMLSLGVAMDMNFQEQMDGMQSLTIIEVYADRYGNVNAPKLNEEGIKAIEAYEGVEMVIPIRETRAHLNFGKYRTDWSVTIKGHSYEEMKVLGYDVASGENFMAEETNVILLGEEVLREFVKEGQEINWNAPPPPMEFELGVDEIEIDIGEYDWSTGDPRQDYEGNDVRPPEPYDVLVKGLFGRENWENAYSATVPITLYNEIVEELVEYEKLLYGEDYETEDPNNFYNVKVKVYDEDLVIPVQDKLNEAGYETYSPIEYLQEMTRAADSIQLMLGGIGGISLLVAAIGIANTMMMSIYERTREIGIMKVIGARLTDIKMMFLFEALTIGALGGIIGLLFSYALSYVLNRFGPQIAGEMFSIIGNSGSNISVIPVWLAVMALVFSTFIGLIAGYFPAKRAMGLSALSAIKTE